MREFDPAAESHGRAVNSPDVYRRAREREFEGDGSARPADRGELQSIDAAPAPIGECLPRTRFNARLFGGRRHRAVLHCKQACRDLFPPRIPARHRVHLAPVVETERIGERRVDGDLTHRVQFLKPSRSGPNTARPIVL